MVSPLAALVSEMVREHPGGDASDDDQYDRKHSAHNTVYTFTCLHAFRQLVLTEFAKYLTESHGQARERPGQAAVLACRQEERQRLPAGGHVARVENLGRHDGLDNRR